MFQLIYLYLKKQKAFVIFNRLDDIGAGNLFGKCQKKIKREMLYNIFIKDTRDSLIRSEDKLVKVLPKISSLLRQEISLVVNKNLSQDLKSIVSLINEKGFDEVIIIKLFIGLVLFIY